MNSDKIRVLVLGAGHNNIGREVVIQLGLSKIEVFEHTYDSLNARQSLAQTVQIARPTHVVYSIGMNRLDWIPNISEQDFVDVMNANVFKFVELLQVLINTGHAYSVVAISSDAAWRPMRTSLAYCASKAALNMAVQVASRELAQYGWRINAVAPGKVANTPMTRYVDETVPILRGWTPEHAEEYERSSSALKRAVVKDEVAEVVIATLFGPPAQTGQIVAVNGGR